MKLSEILGLAPAAPAAPTPAPVGFLSPHAPIGLSPDLVRVLALPRRVPAPVDLTPELKRPGGTMALRPIQSLALAEARARGGLLAPIGVGFGKTLVSLLLPTVMGARNAVLLIPPQLRDQLLGRDYPELSKHWRLPNLAGGRYVYPDAPGFLHVVAYSELSSAARADILDRIQPDLVIADEAHSLRATSSARTKRFRRYMRAHGATRFAGLSGTMTTRSIKDFAHLAHLALRDGSPLPHDWPTLSAWAEALDVSKFPAPPGELLRLCRPGEPPRAGFRRRLVETPGVVATSEATLGTSLVLNRRPLEPDAPTAEALKALRASWALPDGQTFSDALTFSRVARQLALGFWLRWTWPRGEPQALRDEWKAARKDWFAAVRDYLARHARPGADSPLLLANAAASGKWDAPEWAPWAAVKDLCRPETECVWVSDFAINNAAHWAKIHTGVVWVSSPYFGALLSKRTGLPFYSDGSTPPQNLNPTKQMRNAAADIEAKGDWTGKPGAWLNVEQGERTIIASMNAWSTGLNIQRSFSRQLLTYMMSNGKSAEQLLGRLHRDGQPADAVETDIYLHTPESEKALLAARNDAAYQSETLTGAQRLNYATYTFPLPVPFK